MKEYIEREAALKAVCTGCTPQICSLDCDIAAAVKAIPAADVRPVVFCKDCMHSVQGKQSLECEKHRYVWNNMNRWVNDEDFCCWGAKREES